MSTTTNAPIAAINENAPTIERSGPKGNVMSRAGDLLAKMNDAAFSAADEGDAPADEGVETEATETVEEPQVAKTAKKPSKLDELDAKRSKEVARLKKRTADDEAERSRQAEREEWQRERQEMRAVIAKLQGFDPNSPTTMRKVLQDLGADEVARFILDDQDPAKRAEREAQGTKKPENAADPRDAELAALRQQVNDFIGAQQRKENESAFRSRVEALHHDEEGGAPLTATLMKKNPTKVIQMAYGVAQMLAQQKKPFDDDDIIERIESELAEFASLKQAPKQAAPNSIARTMTEHANTEDDDAPSEETAGKKRQPQVRGSVNRREQFLRKAANAKRIVDAMDREYRKG